MLGRQHDRGHLDRLAVFIAHRKLRFRIRSKRRFRTGLAGLRQPLQNRVGIVDGGWHQFRRFADGIAEHDPLIARAFVLVVLRVDALRDMRRLAVQQVGDFAGRVVELVLLIADVLDAGARNAVDAFKVFIQLFCRGQADLTADDDPVGRGKGFTGHPRFGFFRQKRVQNRVGNAVADFVGMTLGNRLRSKGVVLAVHEKCSDI